ncbi:hypothetical protein QOZ80_8AG0619790 [Eleusine coracana subsp. coracana]|nr:hypothetical protein QOZ80_8AG0619790 [Eleusine coracana subsp. coracana]
MVTAPAHVWATFSARKNSSALNWQHKTFPYFDELAPLYEGRYAEGRTRHGMDHYASKSKNASVHSTQAHVAETYQSPSPTLAAPNESGLQFSFDKDMDFLQNPSSPMHNVQPPPSSTQAPSELPESRRGKKPKSKSCSPNEGFHERYLKLKKEEIDRFVAIEEKKLEDPYSINKCITVLEGLHGLQMGDILMASDIFKSN